MNAMPGPFRLTVDQYERMIRHGILTESHNVELIRGEIVPKMSKGDYHTYSVNQLTRLLSKIASDYCYISVQNPVVLADSEPEPDVALLNLRADNYRHGKPNADEVFLLIEVAESTLTFDREVKRPMYAANGIAEYWIVNLVEGCLEIYRDPRADGTYGSVEKRLPTESIQPLLLPQITVDLAQIF